MRVYHFVNEKFGLEDLEKRRLKIAKIEDLNDPFEMFGFSNHDPKMRMAWSLVRTLMDSSFGILCFSRGWHNPVQWSHYADGHRGLCLGFDIPKSHLMEVTYSNRRFSPNLKALTVGNAQGLREITKIFSTKFEHWQYENEVRRVIPLSSAITEGGVHFEKFSPVMLLREVIVGHRSAVTRKQLQDVLKGKAGGVRVIKARLSFKEFRIVRQRNENLWR